MQVPSTSRKFMPNGPRRLLGAAALRGMTLLEMSLVILMLFALVSILFVGARAWKRGSDRVLCIVHIHSVQKSVRSYANLYGFSPGSTVPGFQSKIFGVGHFIETVPICPSAGTYSFGQTYGSDTIPPMGELYMECSHAIDLRHEPIVTPAW